MRQDRRAQNELYGLVHGMLASVSLRYTQDREEAKGFVNLSFVKIINKLDKLTDVSYFYPWARKVAVKTILDELRSKNSKAIDLVHTDFTDTKSVNDVESEMVEADLKLDAEELVALIAKLPPTTARAFNMFAIDGFSHDEVAAALGISPGSSRWHVSTARASLIEMLAKKKDVQLRVNYL